MISQKEDTVRKDRRTLIDEFIIFLTLQLAKAIGPLSRLLVEDSIQAAGYSLKRFPAVCAGDLVETLANEIHRADKKQQFKKDLQRMIQRKGYEKRPLQNPQYF